MFAHRHVDGFRQEEEGRQHNRAHSQFLYIGQAFADQRARRQDDLGGKEAELDASRGALKSIRVRRGPARRTMSNYLAQN
jgi:hypothetical protein